MSDDATGFVGNIPENYDRGLGPIIFADYAGHTARLVAGYAPSRVLETGAGTGIVTRRLRDLLPATTRLIATDLNPPMLEVARKKFRPDEPIEFQHADAMALPFADASFDAVVCQFSVMFFPEKEKSYREAYRVLAPGGRYVFSVWDGAYAPVGRIADGSSHRHREPDRDQVEHHRESEAMKPDAYGGRQGIAHAIEPVAITISAGSAASTDL
jgi:SAM-dependent methyltransferase